MMIFSTLGSRGLDIIKKITMSFLVASLIGGPALPVFAQASDDPSSPADSSAAVDDSNTVPDAPVPPTVPAIATVESSTTPSDEPAKQSEDVNVELPEGVSATTSDSQQDRAPPEQVKVEESISDIASSTGEQILNEDKPKKELTIFKKDDTQSKEAQLAAVRKHLLDNDIPSDIVARLDAFEQEEKNPHQDGIFKRIFDYVTGNTDEQKDREKVEELAKKQPFVTESFDGDVRTANESAYNQLFPDQKEQSQGLLEKIKNFLKSGSSINSDFDGTQAEERPLTWMLGSKAEAVSDDPGGYLAAGAEITFSESIQNKSNELKRDPLTILNFVKNNIDYVPYYGSKKGADSTLVERAGNDTDKASLLIALLRKSNIPARYRHVDGQFSVDTVTNLLGVQTATAAAQMLSLNSIPYILFNDTNGNPVFFVIEHTYVEAYIPYGYSRGADLNDGGTSQWVPMDPSINTYTYTRSVDLIDFMNSNGFNAETFFYNYLQANYGSTTEPLTAFKSVLTGYLASTSPTYYPGLTYDSALTKSYPTFQNESFIPGTLPFHIAADLNTYDYMPASLRHTIQFTVKDKNGTQILDNTSYVSDLADKELLVTFDAASSADQTTLNSFSTIYDVVPLSLVAVYTKLKVNGIGIATSTATTTLGQAQSYVMNFATPRRDIGGSISSSIIETVNRDVVTGNTDAIALDTDRVIPPIFRPAADATSTSFAANQVLYETGVNYLHRLENAEKELANIVGADFADTATRATIFNGVNVTYSGNQPYSFSWKGLRIDASAKVRYFSRFHNQVSTHKKEFTSVFGLQASQEESNIFEENFNVPSVSTVKALKFVSAGAFAGVTLRKITSANESDIDTLSVSTTTMAVYHSAVQAGKTLYTPSAPFTYGNWTGLVYITIDFNQGVAGYIIGEGLNGGYTVAAFSTGWLNFLSSNKGSFSVLSANIVTPTNNQTFTQNGVTVIPWDVQYTATFAGAPISNWREQLSLPTISFPVGAVTLRSGYGTSASVNVNIALTTIGSPGASGNNNFTLDELIQQNMASTGIPSGVLKAIIGQESGGGYFSTRYEPCIDLGMKDAGLYTTLPYSYFVIGGGGLTQGTGATNFSSNNPKGYTPGQMVDAFSLSRFQLPGSAVPTVWEVYSANKDFYSYCHDVTAANGNYPAQFLLATSYGAVQTLYREAVNSGFNTNSLTSADFSPPRNTWDLFSVEENVKMGARILKTKYDTATSLGKGYVAMECNISNYPTSYFISTYGSNWVSELYADFLSGAPRWLSIDSVLTTAKDRLWWAVRYYNGNAPQTIEYANSVCGKYRAQNP